MSDSQALRRFPELIVGGNGIAAIQQNGIWRISANLQNLTITPTGAAAPVNLADNLALLNSQFSGTKNILNIDDGFYDIPGSGNGYSADDGSF